MSIIDSLITDRTEADVLKLRSLLSKPRSLWTAQEWSVFILAKDKGAYNATDLNRVQEAMEYLAERFRGYSYYVPEIKRPDIDGRDYWQIGDIPRKEHLDLYLENLGIIRELNGVLQTTPEVPEDMEPLLYDKANDIEQILFDVDYLLTMMELNWFYTAEVFCGEV